MISAISRDGHRRRHHARLDEGQAHPEPQQDRQEQNSRSMPGPAMHGARNMAPSAAISKVLLSKGLHGPSSSSATSPLAQAATSMIIVIPPPPWTSAPSLVMWWLMWQWSSHLPGLRAVQTIS